MINPDENGYQFIFDEALREQIEKDLEPIDFGQMIFDASPSRRSRSTRSW